MKKNVSCHIHTTTPPPFTEGLFYFCFFSLNVAPSSGERHSWSEATWIPKRMKAGTWLFWSGLYSDTRTADRPFLLAGFTVPCPPPPPSETAVTTGPLLLFAAGHFLVHVYFSAVQSMFSTAVPWLACTAFGVIRLLYSLCSFALSSFVMMQSWESKAKSTFLTRQLAAWTFPVGWSAASKPRQQWKASALLTRICKEPNFGWCY